MKCAYYRQRIKSLINPQIPDIIIFCPSLDENNIYMNQSKVNPTKFGLFSRKKFSKNQKIINKEQNYYVQQEIYPSSFFSFIFYISKSNDYKISNIKYSKDNNGYISTKNINPNDELILKELI